MLKVELPRLAVSAHGYITAQVISDRLNSIIETLEKNFNDMVVAISKVESNNESLLEKLNAVCSRIDSLEKMASTTHAHIPTIGAKFDPKEFIESNFNDFKQTFSYCTGPEEDVQKCREDFVASKVKGLTEEQKKQLEEYLIREDFNETQKELNEKFYDEMRKLGGMIPFESFGDWKRNCLEKQNDDLLEKNKILLKENNELKKEFNYKSKMLDEIIKKMKEDLKNNITFPVKYGILACSIWKIQELFVRGVK